MIWWKIDKELTFWRYRFGFYWHKVPGGFLFRIVLLKQLDDGMWKHLFEFDKRNLRQCTRDVILSKLTNIYLNQQKIINRQGEILKRSGYHPGSVIRIGKLNVPEWVYTDEHGDHIKADSLLLDYINDEEIARLYGKIRKWYGGIYKTYK